MALPTLNQPRARLGYYGRSSSGLLRQPDQPDPNVPPSPTPYAPNMPLLHQRDLPAQSAGMDALPQNLRPPGDKYDSPGFRQGLDLLQQKEAARNSLHNRNMATYQSMNQPGYANGGGGYGGQQGVSPVNMPAPMPPQGFQQATPGELGNINNRNLTPQQQLYTSVMPGMTQRSIAQDIPAGPRPGFVASGRLGGAGFNPGTYRGLAEPDSEARMNNVSVGPGLDVSQSQLAMNRQNALQRQAFQSQHDRDILALRSMRQHPGMINGPAGVGALGRQAIAQAQFNSMATQAAAGGAQQPWSPAGSPGPIPMMPSLSSAQPGMQNAAKAGQAYTSSPAGQQIAAAHQANGLQGVYNYLSNNMSRMSPQDKIDAANWFQQMQSNPKFGPGGTPSSMQSSMGGIGQTPVGRVVGGAAMGAMMGGLHSGPPADPYHAKIKQLLGIP